MGSELLADQLSYNHRVVKVNTEGLTHDDSLAAPAGGGNCLNWVLGHVTTSRNGIAKLLGLEPIWDEQRAAPYGRGSEPISAETALPTKEILADFAASQKTILPALTALTDEDLAVKSPISFFKGDEETVGSALAAFVFHETYHIGQSGILRRAAGKEGAMSPSSFT